MVLLRHLKGNAIAYVALFLALSMGTAWALQKNSVKSKHIADGQVKTRDLAKNSVKSKNIANGQVKAADLASLIPRKFELRAAESEPSSADKSVDVECSPGKVVVSGGFAVEGAPGVTAVTQSRPVNPPLTPYTGWRVSAIEVNGGTTDPWTVTVIAQCADMGIE